MSTPLLAEYKARLDPSNSGPTWVGSWFISHGLGSPAAGTYTEVAFDLRVIKAESVNLPEAVLDDVVRLVARSLYGSAYAATYRPDQYEHAIARHGLRRRERVIVTSIEVRDL